MVEHPGLSGRPTRKLDRDGLTPAHPRQGNTVGGYGCRRHRPRRLGPQPRSFFPAELDRVRLKILPIVRMAIAP